MAGPGCSRSRQARCVCTRGGGRAGHLIEPSAEEIAQCEAELARWAGLREQFKKGAHAKTAEGQQAAQAAFLHGKVTKLYLALVYVVPNITKDCFVLALGHGIDELLPIDLRVAIGV